jgi:hypothetical protein
MRRVHEYPRHSELPKEPRGPYENDVCERPMNPQRTNQCEQREDATRSPDDGHSVPKHSTHRVLPLIFGYDTTS